MAILVTGGAGYIGSHTLIELKEAGYETITFDNLSKGHIQAVTTGKFIKGDILDTNILEKTFKKYNIEAVIHFAADSLVGESMEKPDKYFKTNITGGLNILNMMIKYNVRNIIFSSTAAVYGTPVRIPIEETHKTEPENPYGESKLAFEKILKWYEKIYGIKYISLRYFNACGAHISGKIGEDHSPETHLIPVVLLSVLNDKTVNIFGADYDTKDGTCIRDYIHVSDLARAHVLALNKLKEKNSKSQIYNLGNRKGYSVREIIEAVEKITNKRIKTKVVKRRPGDPPVLIASDKKIKEELKWKPVFDDIYKIIETAWKWHKEHPQGYKK